MRNQLITAFLIMTWFTSFATHTVNAQTSRRLVIHIPFEFIVEDQILPEGTYVVERIDQTKPNVVMFKNADNGTHRLLLTQRVEKEGMNSESCLIFIRHGKQLHLTQIWTKGNSHGQQVPWSTDGETRRQGDTETGNPYHRVTASPSPVIKSKQR